MNDEGALAAARQYLTGAGVTVARVEERSFPGERWLLIFVAPESMALAQSLAGDLERELNTAEAPEPQFAVTFRPHQAEPATTVDAPVAKPGLSSTQIDQLIQLLEARSRTSDALPSLKYVQDPRVGSTALGASRHQLIYGRRGVGKTALMLEAKRLATEEGHVCVWLNAHTLRHMDAETAFVHVVELIFASLKQHFGTSQSAVFLRLQAEADYISEVRAGGEVQASSVQSRMVQLNGALRGVLRSDVVRLYLFLDDFYLYPIEAQSILLDYLAGALRDSNGWLKVASIERLTRPFEPSTRVGLEIPHDALKVDLDMTLEEPASAQRFLEQMLSNYTSTAGLRSPQSVAKSEALGRLVLASGAVPRDYLNLFAASIVVARETGKERREVGKEDVSVAAGRSSRSKKRDLEMDVASAQALFLLRATEALSGIVKSQGFTYFLVDFQQKNHPAYDFLARIVDLRFVHVINSAISDQHRSGVRYEAYLLDLSEYTDVRLRRGLNILDLKDGGWTWRLSGSARTQQTLTGTHFRDKLRQAPVVDLDVLEPALEGWKG